MILLKKSVEAVTRDDFEQVLKHEIESLDINELPLQQAMRQSSYISGDAFSVMIQHSKINQENILVKVGVFYSGVIAGCNCSDDPTPVNENNEYCELELEIDRQAAIARVKLFE